MLSSEGKIGPQLKEIELVEDEIKMAIRKRKNKNISGIDELKIGLFKENMDVFAPV